MVDCGLEGFAVGAFSHNRKIAVLQTHAVLWSLIEP